MYPCLCCSEFQRLPAFIQDILQVRAGYSPGLYTRYPKLLGFEFGARREQAYLCQHSARGCILAITNPILYKYPAWFACANAARWVSSRVLRCANPQLHSTGKAAAEVPSGYFSPVDLCVSWAHPSHLKPVSWQGEKDAQCWAHSPQD